MMAALFLMFLLAQCCIFMGYRKTAIGLTFVNFILCGVMFWSHITYNIPINL